MYCIYQTCCHILFAVDSSTLNYLSLFSALGHSIDKIGVLRNSIPASNKMWIVIIILFIHMFRYTSWGIPFCCPATPVTPIG